MGLFVDLKGKKFGKLTVSERVENSPSNRTRWLCQCDCGKTKIATSRALIKGYTQSCGCYKKKISNKRMINLVGQRFGRWTVLERAENSKYGTTMWKCKCDCGTIRIVSGCNLRNKISTSCGCFSSESTSKRNKKYFEKTNDLTGQRFGKLVVIERTSKRSNKQVVYKCKCDCGGTAFVRGSKLSDGSTSSCGCLSSKGEELIAKILRENNIQYEKQKTFEACRNPKTNALLRYDFWVNDSYLIEYDGEQHFKNKGFGHDNLKERKERDELKNNFCRKQGIPLIRIPYTRYKNLCLDDLMIKSSNFIIQ